MAAILLDDGTYRRKKTLSAKDVEVQEKKRVCYSSAVFHAQENSTPLRPVTEDEENVEQLGEMGEMNSGAAWKPYQTMAGIIVEFGKKGTGHLMNKEKLQISIQPDPNTEKPNSTWDGSFDDNQDDFSFASSDKRMDRVPFKPYTIEDDEAIIKTIIDIGDNYKMRGNALYDTAELTLKASIGRKSQGIKERFRKRIIRNIEKQLKEGTKLYDFPRNELRKLLGRYNGDDIKMINCRKATEGIIKEILAKDGNPSSNAFWDKLLQDIEDRDDHPLYDVSTPQILKLIKCVLVPKFSLYASSLDPNEVAKLKRKLGLSYQEFFSSDDSSDSSKGINGSKKYPSKKPEIETIEGGCGVSLKDVDGVGETIETTWTSNTLKFPTSEEDEVVVENAIQFVSTIYNDQSSVNFERKTHAEKVIKQLATMHKLFEAVKTRTE